MAGDRPYVALATLPNGDVQLVDYRQPPGQTHRILRYSYQSFRLKVALGDILTPAEYNEGFKSSRIRDAEIHLGRVLGGAEDVFDLTDNHEVLLKVGEAVPRGQYVGTIKGASSHVVISVEKQIGHGKTTDYDLGNWYDYNRGKTTEIALVVAVEDGSPARSRVLNASKPAVSPVQPWKIEIPWWRPFFMPAMRIVKFFQTLF